MPGSLHRAGTREIEKARERVKYMSDFDEESSKRVAQQVADVADLHAMSHSDIMDAYTTARKSFENSLWADRFDTAIVGYVASRPAFVVEFIELFVAHDDPQVRWFAADLTTQTVAYSDMLSVSLQWFEKLSNDNDREVLGNLAERLREYVLKDLADQLDLKTIITLTLYLNKAHKRYQEMTGR